MCYALLLEKSGVLGRSLSMPGRNLSMQGRNLSLLGRSLCVLSLGRSLHVLGRSLRMLGRSLAVLLSYLCNSMCYALLTERVVEWIVGKHAGAEFGRAGSNQPCVQHQGCYQMTYAIRCAMHCCWKATGTH